jgi:hypothetical protein
LASAFWTVEFAGKLIFVVEPSTVMNTWISGNPGVGIDWQDARIKQSERRIMTTVFRMVDVQIFCD